MAERHTIMQINDLFSIWFPRKPNGEFCDHATFVLGEEWWTWRHHPYAYQAVNAAGAGILYRWMRFELEHRPYHTGWKVNWAVLEEAVDNALVLRRFKYPGHPERRLSPNGGALVIEEMMELDEGGPAGGVDDGRVEDQDDEEDEEESEEDKEKLEEGDNDDDNDDGAMDADIVYNGGAPQRSHDSSDEAPSPKKRGRPKKKS